MKQVGIVTQRFFVSTPVIQIRPSFMCIGLEGNVEKVLGKD